MYTTSTTNIAYDFERVVADEIWLPPVIKVPEIAGDVELRNRAAEFIGQAVLRSTAYRETKYIEDSYSLMDAIHAAAEGSVEAYEMVRNNVSTDMIERTLKSGHITKVKLQVNNMGEIVQHGQTAADIQKNSLRYASNYAQMRERTEAEVRNMYRLEEAYKHDILGDYCFVVFSPAADNMSENQMKEVGFFTDTMSCSIQVMSLEQGELHLESAFVAGKSVWHAARHDKLTLAKVGKTLGVDYTNMTSVEILDTPLLIHKSEIPNGVIDLVELYDDCAGGTFFGEDKPRQDYKIFRQACRDREARLMSRVELTTEQLISEAKDLKTPQDTSRRLGKLSEIQMIEASVHDTSINPRVFGDAAAWRIEQARYYAKVGQPGFMKQAIEQARLVAVSSSCPGGLGNNKTDIDEFGDNLPTSFEQSTNDCEFVSKECPKCHKKNVKTIVKKGVYYGDCGCHS